MTDFLANSPLTDGEVVGAVTIPCISPAPLDRRLSLTQIRNFARAGLTLDSLTTPGWLQLFIAAGNDGDEGDARGALGVDPAGTALAQFAPLNAAFTALVGDLHVVAFSGNIVDLNGVQVPLENLMNATTQPAAQAALGLLNANAYKSDDEVDSGNIPQPDDHLSVTLPVGVYDVDATIFVTLDAASGLALDFSFTSDEGLVVPPEGCLAVQMIHADAIISPPQWMYAFAGGGAIVMDTPGGGGNHTLTIKGCIEIATAGTLTLLWSQNDVVKSSEATFRKYSSIAFRQK